MEKKIVQTAGRTQLGDFAPLFAEANDDFLFGKVWNDPSVDVKTRCIITVTSLVSMGITDGSLSYHLQNAKNHGVSKAEIAGILTQVGFYAGWPKAWAAFGLAGAVWKDAAPALTEKERFAQELMFPIGGPNDAYAKYFKGQSYLAPVSTEQVPIYNVTFEPKCRNNWHIHHADKGGGPASHLCRRKRYLSSLGEETRPHAARIGRSHSSGGQALAWCRDRCLVQPSGHGSRRRQYIQ